MQICTRCLYTSAHPLNLTFDDEGVCSGCRVHEEKDRIDWSERSDKLRDLLHAYRNRSGNNYDCIIPVSGARDSYYIVHAIKNIYGMNPLLVTYNKQYNTSVGIRNLSNLRMRFDCDIITQTINPEVVKKITRATMRRLGSIYWHCIAGQTVFPVHAAVKFKIPLVIWGAHQGIDQVGMFSHYDFVEMTRKYRKEHDLMGYEAEDLINEFDEIKEKDVMPYCYPNSSELTRVGVRGIYLNNYIRWDSRSQHEKMIHEYGYESAVQNRTYDKYNDVDCWNYSDTHDYIKMLKHGYGKVVDHACRDIRLGHISRKDALELVKKYMYRRVKNIDHFLEWIGVTKNSFDYILDQHRNRDIWYRDNDWKWKIRDIYKEKSNIALVDCPSDNFIETPVGVSSDNNNKYILIGKGVPA